MSFTEHREALQEGLPLTLPRGLGLAHEDPQAGKAKPEGPQDTKFPSWEMAEASRKSLHPLSLPLGEQVGRSSWGFHYGGPCQVCWRPQAVRKDFLSAHVWIFGLLETE